MHVVDEFGLQLIQKSTEITSNIICGRDEYVQSELYHNVRFGPRMANRTAHYGMVWEKYH